VVRVIRIAIAHHTLARLGHAGRTDPDAEDSEFTDAEIGEMLDDELV
jgi:hypothetical protein